VNKKPGIITSQGYFQFVQYRDLPEFLRDRSKQVECNPLVIANENTIGDRVSGAGVDYVMTGELRVLKEIFVIAYVKGDTARPATAAPFPKKDDEHKDYLRYFPGDSGETMVMLHNQVRVIYLKDEEKLDSNPILDAAVGPFVALAFFFSTKGNSFPLPMSEAALKSYFGQQIDTKVH